MVVNDLSYANNKDEDQVVHSDHLKSHYMYYITGISTLGIVIWTKIKISA